MHLLTIQNNSVFFNSHFKWIEHIFFRVERKTIGRYYVLILNKCEIVFKFFASHCMLLGFTKDQP